MCLILLEVSVKINGDPYPIVAPTAIIVVFNIKAQPIFQATLHKKKS